VTLDSRGNLDSVFLGLFGVGNCVLSDQIRGHRATPYRFFSEAMFHGSRPWTSAEKNTVLKPGALTS
jgi:hypothetical protein